MRYFLLSLLIICSSTLAAPATVESVPNQRQINGSHVSDPDSIVGVDAAAQIDSLLISLERDTGVQVAVVAVESIGNEDVFSFAQALFERWGIGDQKRDEGLLVLLVKDQNTIRMHTGYGLEGALPDVVLKRIQHKYMVPAFKAGRYGDGVLTGLNAVVSVLADPTNAQVLASEGSTSKNWHHFKIMFSFLGGGALVCVFAYALLSGSFSTKTAIKKGIPVSMRWKAIPLMMTFASGPILIVTAVNFARLDSPIFVSCIALYGYFMLFAGFQAWRQHRAVHKMLKMDDYFKSYTLTNSQQSFWFWIALLFPLPFLPHYFFSRHLKNRFRKHPRNCPKCKAPMRRLSEDEEDTYLSKAQQMEETLLSADHDIWQCGACETTINTTYSGSELKYEKCPSCKTVAYFEENSKTLVEPTRSRNGKGETLHSCMFCGHKKTNKFSIAKLGNPNSSSGSSSSSRSGSSWGGGSSGGGGSSSSW